MRKEALNHAWPVASPQAYPTVIKQGRDGSPSPVASEEMQLVTLCALGLASLYDQNPSSFSPETFNEPCELNLEAEGVEVQVVYPYMYATAPETRPPALELVKENSVAKPGLAGVPSGDRVSRNSPCPCGSGKKFKKCCLLARQEDKSQEACAAQAHELDGKLVRHIMRFADRKFGDPWHRCGEDFADPDATMQLFVPWCVFGFQIKGRCAAEWYLDEEARKLSSRERAWIDAQLASWLSLWEINEVHPGRGLTISDALTGERRVVLEKGGSKNLVKHDVILARVVEFEDMFLLCGAHPGFFSPRKAGPIIEGMRKYLRRKSNVPVERLRPQKVGRKMISLWEEAAHGLDMERDAPKVLHNTDGDEVLLTKDHFSLKAPMTEIAQRLADLEGFDDDGKEERQHTFVVTTEGNAMHDWDNTIVGRAFLSAESLKLETNSVARSDALRKRVETACGKHIQHRLREHSDPTGPIGEFAWGPGASGATSPAPLPPEDAARIIQEFKAKHYASWATKPLPALQGKTPKEAVRTKSGRKQVELLVKDCENTEARLPVGECFDFSNLRSELGLD